MAQRASMIVSDDAILDGEPRIEGHRIGVLQVHEEVEEGNVSPRTFADRYGLDVAAVYRALAYYHEHPNEMAAARRRRSERIEAVREDALGPGTVE